MRIAVGAAGGLVLAITSLVLSTAPSAAAETRFPDQLLHRPALPPLAQMGATVALASATQRIVVSAPGANATEGFTFDPVIGVWEWGFGSGWGGPEAERIAVAADGETLLYSRFQADGTTDILRLLPGAPLITGISGEVQSLAKSGSYIAVGEPSFGDERGIVLIYELESGAWELDEFFIGGEPWARLGESLAFDGSVLVAGAPLEGDCGAVHVYVHTSSWFELQTIDCPSQQTHADFGAAVALDGDNLVVGAPRLDHLVPGGANVLDVGGVYSFDVSFVLFELETLFRPASTGAGDNFGASVALWRTGGSGLAAVVGSPNEDDEEMNQGAAYLFLHHGTRWRERLRMADASPNQQDQLGMAVAIGPMGVVAGEPNNSDLGVTVQGALAAYTGIVPLFYDSFESGNSSHWSSSLP